MNSPSTLTETVSSPTVDPMVDREGLALRRAAAVIAAAVPAACGGGVESPTSPSSSSTSTSTAVSAVARAPIEHLLRRAGFSGSPDEVTSFARMGYTAAVDALLNYDVVAAQAIDSSIRTPGYVGVIATREFTPNTTIGDARQRWLFRMVHSPAPLQEKMAMQRSHSLQPSTSQQITSNRFMQCGLYCD